MFEYKELGREEGFPFTWDYGRRQVTLRLSRQASEEMYSQSGARRERCAVLEDESGRKYFLKYGTTENSRAHLMREIRFQEIFSPYLLRVYGGLYLGEGAYGVVSEYLDDMTTLTRLVQGESWPRVSQADRRQIVLEFLMAMKAYQDLGGRYHRDLKPDNIMVRLSGGEGDAPGRVQLRIIDFDWAYTGDESEDRPVYGTPYYAHPYQYRAGWTGKDNGLYLDLYSAALVISFIVTGQQYFDRARAPWYERGVFREQDEESAFTYRHAGVPAGLAAILQKMMTPPQYASGKPRAVRRFYQTVDQVIADYRGFLEQEGHLEEAQAKSSVLRPSPAVRGAKTRRVRIAVRNGARNTKVLGNYESYRFGTGNRVLFLVMNADGRLYLFLTDERVRIEGSEERLTAVNPHWQLNLRCGDLEIEVRDMG